MIKKFLALLLIGAMMLTICSCGKSGDGASSIGSSNTDSSQNNESNSDNSKDDIVSDELQEQYKPFVIDVKYDDGMEIPIAVIDAKKDCGAVGDGVTDDTDAINLALSMAQMLGGGTVYLPEGKYLCNSFLIVPSNVTLRGEWVSPDKASVGSCGTILLTTGGRGDAEGDAFINLMRSSSLRNITIMYPDQKPNDIAVYPPTVDHIGKYCQSLINVTISGAYEGVIFGRKETQECYYLKNVYIAAAKMGVYTNDITDVGRAENVHCSPEYWTENVLYNLNESQKKTIVNYFRKNAVGLEYYRNDWSYHYETFFEDLKTGIYFGETPRGSFSGEFTNTYIKNCDIGILSEGVQSWGISFANTKISSDWNATAAIYAQSPKNVGICQFNSLEITGNYKTPVVNKDEGSLQFVSCSIPSGINGGYAVTVEKGGFTAQGTKFTGTTNHVNVGDEVSGVSILGCTYAGEKKITLTQAAQANADIDDTPVQLEMLSGSYHTYKSSTPNPASKIIYNVKDYGGDTENDDNTAAFEKALNAARKTGGIVYVPGGRWILRGTITVPTGVELRGCLDIPSIKSENVGVVGTVIVTYANKGKEDAEAFISLESGAGVRGFEVWYPDQDSVNAVEYPWTIRGLGPNVWAVNIVLPNSYNGIDFGTHPSKNHYISGVTGMPLRRGVFVGNNDGDGWVEAVHFNPNFGKNISSITELYDVLTYTCDTFIFGDNKNEHVLNCFVFGARNGMLFMSQGDGGTSGTIIGFGVDSAETSLRLHEAKNLEFVNPQLVAMRSNNEKRNVYAEASFTGTAKLFSSIFYGPTTKVMLVAGGNVTFNGVSCRDRFGDNYLEVTGGNVSMNGAWMYHAKGILVSDKAKSVTLIGNYMDGKGKTPLVVNKSEAKLTDIHGWWS